MGKLPHWEVRLRGNAPKFADIMRVGAADSSGAIARVPLRDGFRAKAMREATMIAGAPAMLRALKHIRRWGIGDGFGVLFRVCQPEAYDQFIKAKT